MDATILTLPGWHGGSQGSAALPDVHQGMLRHFFSPSSSSMPILLQAEWESTRG